MNDINTAEFARNGGEHGGATAAVASASNGACCNAGPFLFGGPVSYDIQY